MKKLLDVSALCKGDKLLRVEYNQGLNGAVERLYAHLVTVEKVTKAKVHIFDDVYNLGFALNKSTYNPNSSFYYGKKTEYYIPDASESGSIPFAAIQ